DLPDILVKPCVDHVELADMRESWLILPIAAGATDGFVGVAAALGVLILGLVTVLDRRRRCDPGRGHQAAIRRLLRQTNYRMYHLLTWLTLGLLAIVNAFRPEQIGKEPLAVTILTGSLPPLIVFLVVLTVRARLRAHRLARRLPRNSPVVVPSGQG
ncbi:MAG: hypothetical protein RMJ35_07675, partial [Phycisphaerales bacterium]|nr:hypothetical protein [Phycisphaerales bacterium]